VPDIDAQVHRLMAAGASDDDIVFFLKNQPKVDAPSKPAMPPPDPAPGFLDRMGALASNPGAGKAAQAGAALMSYVGKNPVQAGAMAGGLATAPFTGGLSIPAAMAATGMASAAGAGAGALTKQAVTGEADPNLGQTMAVQGALGAGGEGVGQVVGRGAAMLGKGLYRAAALPIKQFGKYGDQIQQGLDRGVLVSQGGLAKATRLKDAAQTTKADALALRGRLGVVHDAGAIARDAGGPLAADAAKMSRAGYGDRSGAYADQLSEFVAQNPQGSLTPTALDEVKQTWDNAAGPAFQKMRMKESLSPSDRYTVEMTGAARRAQESAVPGYTAMNREIMTNEGLRRMVNRRVNPTAGGGNQGLENAMTMAATAMAGPAAIPARLAMLPPVLSAAGIAAYKGAKLGQPGATAVLKALLAMLGPNGQQEQQQAPEE